MNTVKFLGWLTGIVVLMYIGTAIFSFLRNGLSWSDFSGTVGPISGLLLGYWVRSQS